MPDLSDRAREIEDTLIVDAVRELEDHAAGDLALAPDTGDRVVPIPGRPRDLNPDEPRALDARSSSIAPSVTMRPPTIIATRSHTRSTSSSWWLEKTIGTPRDLRS